MGSPHDGLLPEWLQCELRNVALDTVQKVSRGSTGSVSVSVFLDSKNERCPESFDTPTRGEKRLACRAIWQYDPTAFPHLFDLPEMLSALIGAFLSGIVMWIVRGHFDKRAEHSSLRREIFREYMTITDSNSNRLYALHRSGAMRLPRADFGKLIDELSKVGRSPLKDSSDDLISDRNLYEILQVAGRHQVEFHSDNDLEYWILHKMAERTDQGLPSDVRSTLKGIKNCGEADS